MKVFISSHYQSHKYRKKYGAYRQAILNCQSDRKLDIIKTIDKMVIKGVIQASQENYDTLIKLTSHYGGDLQDYHTALCCDIEVAIEEQKIIKTCELLHVDFELIPHPHAKIQFLNDVTIDVADIKDDDLIDGDVYIINTHGKKQSIDGDYKHALQQGKTIKRIIIDACHSAQGNFPLIHSGTDSYIGTVADEAIRSKLDDNTEIVGFKDKFDVSRNLFIGPTFLKKEKLFEEENFSHDKLSFENYMIALITVKGRKEYHQKRKQRKMAADQSSKNELRDKKRAYYRKVANNHLIEKMNKSLTGDIEPLCRYLQSTVLGDFMSRAAKKSKKHPSKLDSLTVNKTEKDLFNLLEKLAGQTISYFDKTKAVYEKGGKVRKKKFYKLFSDARKKFYQQQTAFSALLKLAKAVVDAVRRTDYKKVRQAANVSKKLEQLQANIDVCEQEYSKLNKISVGEHTLFGKLKSCDINQRLNNGSTSVAIDNTM